VAGIGVGVGSVVAEPLDAEVDQELDEPSAVVGEPGAGGAVKEDDDLEAVLDPEVEQLRGLGTLAAAAVQR
jgi:hypothetical protein